MVLPSNLTSSDPNMSDSTTTHPPAHARPFHKIETPRLIFRSTLPSDAEPFAKIRSGPMNNPFGGVVDPDLTVKVQRQYLEAQVGIHSKRRKRFHVYHTQNHLILKRWRSFAFQSRQRLFGRHDGLQHLHLRIPFTQK